MSDTTIAADPIVDANQPTTPDPAPAPPAPAPDPDPPAPKPSPFQERLGEVTRLRREAERERDLYKTEADDLRARLAAAGAQTPSPAAPGQQPAAGNLPPGVTPADIDRLANQRAQALVQQREAQQAEQSRQQAWNGIITAGQAKYTPAAFDAACADLASLGAGENKSFIEAVSTVDNGAAILQHLGTHPDEAARILNMSGAKMAIELARLEVKINTPALKPVSRVPPPLDPIAGSGGGGENDIYDPNLTPAQYQELRAKQRKKA